jgi:hypothetical protein
MFLTQRDLDEEVCQHFIEKSLHSSEVTTAICKKMLQYTNGHLFPFVKLMEHLVSRKIPDINDIDYYVGSKDFMSSSLACEIRNRCFDSLPESLGDLEKLLFRKERSNEGIAFRLFKAGIWINGDFISGLVRNEAFHLAQLLMNEPTTKTLDDSKPYIEQLICAGLEKFTEDDFKDPVVDTIAVENAISFRWAWNIKLSLKEVWVVSQVRTMYKEKSTVGAKPCIDFIFNGRLDRLAVEVVVDNNSKGVEKHLKRFDENYSYLKENGFVFHIQTKDKDPELNFSYPYDTDTAKSRVYTFNKHRNALYRGSENVMTGIVKAFSVPPSFKPNSTTRRSFSTLTHLIRRFKF